MITIAKKSLNKTISYQSLILTTIRKKYVYFLVGLTIIIAGLVLFLTFFVKKNLITIKPNSKKEVKEIKIQSLKKNQYTVKTGDNLWRIAENTYGSGYNAYDIAIANKIDNPNLIIPGQILILPSVTPKPPTKGEIVTAKTEKAMTSITQYTVKQGDYLWKIALEIYGDGYAWVKIAQANQLANPNLIHVGNVLTIPR